MNNVRSFIIILVCLAANYALADTPGKKHMSDSKVSFQNIKKFEQYNFYWQLANNSVQQVSTDTSEIVPGSAGRPYDAAFWAVNKETKRSTDTVTFQNYYAPDYVVILDTITNKIIYHKSVLSNNNQLTDNTGAGEVENKDLVNDAKKANINHLIKMIVWGGVSAIAFILLVWLFIRRKNRQP